MTDDVDEYPAPPVDATWTKSSFSGTGNCVEWYMTDTHVFMRDSKNPDTRAHAFTREQWRQVKAEGALVWEREPTPCTHKAAGSDTRKPADGFPDREAGTLMQDQAQTEWIKASASSGAGQCAEMRPVGDMIEVRDSKDPEGPRLRFTKPEIASWIDGAKRGEFDHLV